MADNIVFSVSTADPKSVPVPTSSTPAAADSPPVTTLDAETRNTVPAMQLPPIATPPQPLAAGFVITPALPQFAPEAMVPIVPFPAADSPVTDVAGVFHVTLASQLDAATECLRVAELAEATAGEAAAATGASGAVKDAHKTARGELKLAKCSGS